MNCEEILAHNLESITALSNEDLILLFKALGKHIPEIDARITLLRNLMRQNRNSRTRYKRQIKRLNEKADCLSMIRTHLDAVGDARAVDDNQLQQMNSKLKNASILKEFPFYNFKPTLYTDNRFELIKSINNFNQISNQVNLLEVFHQFSNSSFFNEKQSNILQDLLTNADQLDIINNFLFLFLHNLSLMDIDKDDFGILTKQTEKIEHVLVQNPRSSLYNITFNFSIAIEKIKINHSITPDKSADLDRISQSDNLYDLLNFHSSTSHEQKNVIYTIEQQIDAFNTLNDPLLVEEIFSKLKNYGEINSWSQNKKIIEFVRWTTENLERLEYKTKEHVFCIVKNILQKIIISDLSNALQFLRIVLDYKRTKLEIEKQEKEIESTKLNKETFLENIRSCLDKIRTLLEFINLTKSDDLLGVSENELDELKVTCENVLRTLSNQTEMQKIDRILIALEHQR
ncbi:unnamed protein product [Didymodactylos carnosus]|uniref:Uncharacterized protein n=1 Tax=Didymodactylos carnosus TaxID=1234261 RepID=A0A814ALX3_9BILA|nr:unnamed protein product [Didymodactylos carnosus]CAF3694385.1 unnamed protein product [Didymodactylos carnosus]